jgi:hypothetical protein
VAPDTARAAHRIRQWGGAEEIVAGMARAVAHLRPGERLDQRSLKRIAREHPDEAIPSYTVVNRHARSAGATFDQWRREAIALAAGWSAAGVSGLVPSGR